MMPFVESLISLRDKYLQDGIKPKDINAGYCADFATVIWEQWRSTGRVQVLADSDLAPMMDYCHTFLKYDGRYYDAEAVDGVDDWRQLPIYARLDLGEPFTLQNDAPPEKVEPLFEPLPKGKQMKLLTGLDCLPNQMDLFDDMTAT